jgi:hypothetical protein
VNYFRSWEKSDPGLTTPWRSWVRFPSPPRLRRKSLPEVMGKRQRKRPSEGGGNGQGNAPPAFRIALRNTDLDLVELPLDPFVFLCPELDELLCVARVYAYSPTWHRPADTTQLGHAALGARRQDRVRGSQNSYLVGPYQVPTLNATEFRASQARRRVGVHITTHVGATSESAIVIPISAIIATQQESYTMSASFWPSPLYPPATTRRIEGIPRWC